MKLSLDGLLVLDAIARKGSFAAAADELHRVPSAITYTVQKLEQDLGVQLFDRSGHRARLTPAGEELLKDGRHLLRTAVDIECRVQRMARGWETELRIAHDDLIPSARLMSLVDAFYREAAGTRLRLAAEVLGGCWDALVSGRADLCIGAPGEPPPEAGYTVRHLGDIEWVFAAAPAHPITQASSPIPTAVVMDHRIVTVADSSRSLPPRSSGITGGPDSFTVSTVQAKLEAQVAGLGVGFVPLHLAAPCLADGRLLQLQVEEPRERTPLYLAWRPRDAGRALKWWVAKLEDSAVRAALLAPADLPDSGYSHH
ncbi:MAG: LysR family transcriptional regulator [Burkholderiales bacterium]|nr:LysR family transcriptional regulator [Burkholderiales bacterium]